MVNKVTKTNVRHRDYVFYNLYLQGICTTQEAKGYHWFFCVTVSSRCIKNPISHDNV